MAVTLSRIVDSGYFLVPPELLGVAPGMNKFEGAMCFEIDDESLVEVSIKSYAAELIRLPFPVCWFEFSKEPYRVGVLAIESRGAIEWNCFFRKGASDPVEKHWRFGGRISELMVVNDGRSLQFCYQGLRSEWTYPFIRFVMDVCVSFLSLLHCANVARVEHFPSEKLMRARAKRGKKPLFSYWTLQLDMSNSECAAELGGTHASPRIHLRRGHVARRKEGPNAGKWWWVSACVVRGSGHGMVHKDYRA